MKTDSSDFEDSVKRRCQNGIGQVKFSAVDSSACCLCTQGQRTTKGWHQCCGSELIFFGFGFGSTNYFFSDSDSNSDLDTDSDS
jgi:hypothetical protein